MSVVVHVMAFRPTPRGRLHVVRVSAETGRSVAPGAVRQLLLGRVRVFVSPVPGLERGILKRAPVGKADLPGLRPGQTIDRVQMGGRQ